MKGEVRKHEHMSLESLVVVGNMAATAQRGRAGNEGAGGGQVVGVDA